MPRIWLIQEKKECNECIVTRKSSKFKLRTLVELLDCGKGEIDNLVHRVKDRLQEFIDWFADGIVTEDVRRQWLDDDAISIGILLGNSDGIHRSC